MSAAESYALKLLTQREHSALELRHKLERKGYADLDENDLLLDKLKKQGWQDDARFAMAYNYSRQMRGYGPLRIQKELQERGIADEIINKVIEEDAPEWIEILAKVIYKKFSGTLAHDFIERAKQFRFLQLKGFSSWHIKQVLKKLNT